MPQTGAAGFPRSDRGGSRPPRITAFDPDGEIVAVDRRAAARAARAEAFAERFGVDDSGPSAASLADAFGFRYESSSQDGQLATGPRTVQITGRGSSRATPPAERTLAARGPRSARHGPGRAPVVFGPRVDRVALIAVALGLVLAFLAATSAHAAVVSTALR